MADAKEIAARHVRAWREGDGKLKLDGHVEAAVAEGIREGRERAAKIVLGCALLRERDRCDLVGAIRSAAKEPDRG